jgi:hypothetical protein
MVAGTSRPLSRPAAASSRTHAESTEWADQDNNDVCRLQRFLDDLGELRSAAHVQVPPDGVAGFLERQSKRSCLVDVVPIVAQEDAGHAQPPAAAMLLPNVVAGK